MCRKLCVCWIVDRAKCLCAHRAAYVQKHLYVQTYNAAQRSDATCDTSTRTNIQQMLLLHMRTEIFAYATMMMCLCVGLHSWYQCARQSASSSGLAMNAREPRCTWNARKSFNDFISAPHAAHALARSTKRETMHISVRAIMLPCAQTQTLRRAPVPGGYRNCYRDRPTHI